MNIFSFLIFPTRSGTDMFIIISFPFQKSYLSYLCMGFFISIGFCTCVCVRVTLQNIDWLRYRRGTKGVFLKIYYIYLYRLTAYKTKYEYVWHIICFFSIYNDDNNKKSSCRQTPLSHTQIHYANIFFSRQIHTYIHTYTKHTNNMCLILIHFFFGGGDIVCNAKKNGRGCYTLNIYRLFSFTFSYEIHAHL